MAKKVKRIFFISLGFLWVMLVDLPAEVNKRVACNLVDVSDHVMAHIIKQAKKYV